MENKEETPAPNDELTLTDFAADIKKHVLDPIPGATVETFVGGIPSHQNKDVEMNLRDAIGIFEEVVQNIDGFLIEISQGVLCGSLPENIIDLTSKLPAPSRLEKPICAVIRAASRIIELEDENRKLKEESPAPKTQNAEMATVKPRGYIRNTTSNRFSQLTTSSFHAERDGKAGDRLVERPDPIAVAVLQALDRKDAEIASLKEGAMRLRESDLRATALAMLMTAWYDAERRLRHSRRGEIARLVQLVKRGKIECPFCGSGRTVFEDDEHHFCESCKCTFWDDKSPTILVEKLVAVLNEKNAEINGLNEILKEEAHRAVRAEAEVARLLNVDNLRKENGDLREVLSYVAGMYHSDAEGNAEDIAEQLAPYIEQDGDD